jgi:hypothetical protein
MKGRFRHSRDKKGRDRKKGEKAGEVIRGERKKRGRGVLKGHTNETDFSISVRQRILAKNSRKFANGKSTHSYQGCGESLRYSLW